MRSVPCAWAAATALTIAGCGGSLSPDARGSLIERPDGSVPPAPDAGPTDAGPDPTDGGVRLGIEITFTEPDFDLLAVSPAGESYGVNLNGSDAEIWASADGRAWAKRGSTPNGASFRTVFPLSGGTLLADVVTSAGHAIARSTDRGVTWSEVLSTGVFRTLTPHSFAELDGAAYYLEYQVFTVKSTTIRLWRSVDQGATWSVRYTFDGHRHGHGMIPDPSRHALWAYFGDSSEQSGAYRSTDGGASWTAIVAAAQEGDIVDAAVLPDGSLLCGQDVSYRGGTPDRPQIARIGLDGAVTHYVTLPSASYSTHAVKSGGYVVGATYELFNDVSPAGWTHASLWGSGDGIFWEKLFDVPQLDVTDDVRSDVYWELPSGELVVNLRNALGFGPSGHGYFLMRAGRR